MEDGEIEEGGGVKRVHLIISGDVQGVGFRAFVREKAKSAGLVGWVKNREDGAVEVVAGGPRKDLEIFLKACHRGPEVSSVEKVEAVWEKSRDEFVGFAVVY